jgi:hypothetical protein
MSNFSENAEVAKFKEDDKVLYNGQECIVLDVYYLPGNKEQPYQYSTNCGPINGLKLDKYGKFIMRIGGRGNKKSRKGKSMKSKSKKSRKSGKSKKNRTKRNNKRK